MPRKGGGPPDGRTDEEQWQPPGREEPLQRSFDMALELELDDEEEDPDFIYGDIVHDTEADEPIALVVINIPGLELDEWEFEDGDTLADKTPKYPDDDEIIVVTPLDVLEQHIPRWGDREAAIPLEDLVEEEIPFAPFPSLQLVRVEDSHLRD